MTTTRTENSGAEARLAAVEASLERLRADIAAQAGSQAGLVEILMRDIAKREEITRSYEDAQSWIQLAQETGGVAAYSMDVPHGPLVWSASTYALYGIDPAETPSLELWLGRIHEDDRANVLEVAQGAVMGGAHPGQEYRIVHPDGSVRWISDRGRVLIDHQGRPIRLVGLNIDITELKMAQAALLEREEEFRLTFEGAAVGVAHVALDSTILKLNPAFARLLGYDVEELLGASSLSMTHPEDAEGHIDPVLRLLAGEIDSFEIEKRYLKKDGSVLWSNLSTSLKRGPDGQALYFISVLSDISSRKAADAMSEVLMGEMLHRANNMFALVQSLVRQTERGAVDVAQFSERLSERIAGLAHSHQLLAGSATAGASLEALVLRQSSAFVRSEDSRIEVSGPKVRLGQTATHTLGMALHELATNACKYGSLSGDTGRVRVTWRVHEAPRPTLELTWVELDGPEVSVPDREGFGKRVITEIAPQRLRGEASLDYARSGLTWRFSCPLERLSD